MLSVTPLMTAVCVVALVWITRHVLHEERMGEDGWNVHKLAVKLGYEKPINYPFGWNVDGWPATPAGDIEVVVERNGHFDLVKCDSLQSDGDSRYIATLFSPKWHSSRGVFAITQHVWIRPISHPVNPALPDERSNWTDHPEKLSNELKPYAEALRSSTHYFYTTTVFQGYALNAAALACVVLGIRSLVWLWRGVPLREFRACFARRPGLCVTCGYSLTGLNADKCPECGADKELKAAS